jgi:hypothetical protein
MRSYDFLVKRNDLTACSVEPASEPPIAPGEVLLRVERFGLTANNITYGVAGDLIGYWRFFPAPGDWGRIPAWGIGTVSASTVEAVAEGGRYFGYFPMSGHLVVSPAKAGPAGFADDVAHRRELPPVYNQYSLMTEALGFPAGQDNHQVIYRPLFTTSFVLADYFADHDNFGAGQVILASASSKTAFGTALMMRDRPQRTIGLTSEANRRFVQRLGLYDQVATYDEVADLDASQPTAYIDMSGNRAVLAAVHRHFGGNLVNSCSVGITHREARTGPDPATLPGARPTLFFAPDQVRKRNEEWGPARFKQNLGAAWGAFLGVVDEWVDILEAPAPGRLESVYQTVLDGAAPNEAHVLVN